MKKILILLIFLILPSLCQSASVNDFIISKGGFGPYALSNTHPANLKVFWGNSEISSNSYLVDPENASIIFMSYIDKGVVLRLDYNKSEKSTPSTRKLNYLMLTKNQRLVDFNVNVFYDDKKEISGVSLSTGTDFAGGVISTELALDTKEELDNINMDKLAGKLEYNRDFGKIKLGATYSKAGDGIGNNTTYNAGSDITDLLLSYNENGIALSSSFTDTNYLGSRQIYNNKIVLTPSSNTKFSFSNITEKSTDTNKYSNTYSLEQSFNKLSLKYAQTEIMSFDSGNKSYSMELLGDKFRLLAKRTDIISDTSITTRTDTASISANPNNNLDINLNTTQTFKEINEKTGETASLGIVSKPNDALQIETKGNYSEDAIGEQFLDASAKFKYSPSHKLGLTLDTDKNFSTDNENLGIGIVSKLTDNLTLQTTGKYADTDIKKLDTESSIKYTLGEKLGLTSVIKTNSATEKKTLHQSNISINYKPIDNIFLLAGFKNQEISEMDYMRISRISASTDFRYLSMSALYIDRYLKTGTLPDSKAVSISLRPIKTITITTSYAVNPENQDSSYLNEIQKSASIDWKIGTFIVTSDVSQRILNFTDNKTTAKLGLKSLLWNGSSISAGLTLDGVMNEYFQGTRTYTLNYLLDMSKDTFIKLGGAYSEKNNSIADSSFKKDNVTAEASIGIKF